MKTRGFKDTGKSIGQCAINNCQARIFKNKKDQSIVKVGKKCSQIFDSDEERRAFFAKIDEESNFILSDAQRALNAINFIIKD